MPARRKYIKDKKKVEKGRGERNAHKNREYARKWRAKQKESRNHLNHDVSGSSTNNNLESSTKTSRKRTMHPDASSTSTSTRNKKRRYEKVKKYKARIRPRTWESYVERFESEVRSSCSQACNCCGRLCFAKNITKLDRAGLESNGAKIDFLNTVFAVNKEGLRKFCHTCTVNIKKNVIPRLCLNNGLHFPKVDPKISCLNRIEERLVSPCHVFQTIWPVMGPHGQLKGKGGIVNVPVNFDTTVSSLPRPKRNSNMIHVRLARRIDYVTDYLQGMATTVKVYDAARCLVKKPLFLEHDIHLSNSWLNHEDTNSDSDEFSYSECEDDIFRYETLLDSNQSIRLAPAEGYTPQSVLLNPHSEFLAFPKIFGGYKMEPTYNGKPLSYSEIMKSFALRFDRRVAERGDYLLFMAKKNELIKLNNNIGICLRKKSNRSQISITADNMLNSSFVSGLIQHDDGFQVLKGIRNSSNYCKQENTKLMAAIRQFGLPTFFVTLSSADTRWPELLVQLKKSVDNEIISEEEAEKLSYNEKARLIQKDSITCTLHFDNRFKELKKTWVCDDGPFGGFQVIHHYHKIEFQQRGSPHAHMILWLEVAPKCDTNSREEQRLACSFIDKIVTCSSTKVSEHLLELQVHKHTRTCRKRNKKEGCRFGIPYFPMKKTRMLQPLDEEFDENEKDRLSNIASRIRELQLSNGAYDLSFKDFVKALNVTETEYILAVRSTLTRSQVFLRRKPSEMFINAYNPKILQLMRSNMDIQYILDPYGCASYVVNYINKSDKGMSLLMQQVLKEIREGNQNLKDALRKISNTHYNNSELCIQEACYNILQLNLSECSEECIFIPTSPPHQRVRMVKSSVELENLDPDSTEIFVDGLLDHYHNRPLHMENITLADFAANYRFSRRATSSTAIPLLCNKGYITKRTKCRIIRYVCYNYETNPDDYFREMLMLYHPWRNEESHILQIDLESTFFSNKDTITEIWSHYNVLKDDIIALALQEATNNVNDDHPSDDENRARFDFDKYYLDDNFVDVLDEGNPSNGYSDKSFNTPPILSNTEYRALLERLNPQQRDYVSHLAHHFKTSKRPVYHFVTGGAGVGKSLVIAAIYQTLKRIFANDEESNPDDKTILVCSYTGKSSFEVSGQTIHSLFRLLLNQKHLNELSPDVSNTMASKLLKLKLVIIDEISMVGQTTFRMIDQRLRHLFNNNKFMGGISVVTTGDFDQLDPVFARPLYYPVSNNEYEEIFSVNVWHQFKVFRLHRIMRQNDPSFQIALNHMAKGEMTVDDVALFTSRTFQSVPPLSDISNAIHLFARNVDVDDWNITSLRNIPGEECTCKASDVIRGHGSPAARRQILHSLQNSKRSDTMGIPLNVVLKVGAIYMLTYNVDSSDGLANGVTGQLKKIDFGTSKDGSKKPLRLWMHFDNASVGRSQRRKNERVIEHYKVPVSWTPMEPIIVKVKTKTNSTLHVVRKQFPITLAHALTIHKSQGMSIKTVVVHIKGSLSRSLLYVACSRATHLNGLFIIGNFKPPKPLPVSSYLRQEMLRWENNMITPVFRFLRENTDHFQIYHNVQSLLKNLTLTQNDLCFMKSHVMCFGETWTTSSDELSIPGFDLLERIDNRNSRKARGVCVFIHNSLRQSIHASDSFVLTQGKGRIEVCWIRIHHTTIISVYASPRCDISLFKKFFEEIDRLRSRNILVIGDFNVNSNQTTPVTDIARMYGLILQNEGQPTTVYGSSLDWILSNCKMSVGTYVSFTSYHDPIYARLPFPSI